jgi:hypothetical protein
MKNYYQVLGLEKNATQEEVKKAYKLYASKFHPDKQNEDKFFEERFKEIKEAYDILSDTERRHLYDSAFEPNNTHPKPKPDYPTYKTNSYDKNTKEENTLVVHYQREHTCITNQYIEGYFSSESKQRFMFSEIKDIVHEEKLNVFATTFASIGCLALLIGLIVIISFGGLAALFDSTILFAAVICIVSCFFLLLKTRHVITIIDKTDKKHKLKLSSDECKKIEWILKKLMKEQQK